jgi:hypothetical protein
MTDGYLSKKREHIAGQQRRRRARFARIDYYPNPDAIALIESRRTRYGPTNNNSGIIDTIIAEWAVLAGIKQSKVEKPKTPANRPEFSHQNARARMSPSSLAKCVDAPAAITSKIPEFLPTSPARACANDSGRDEVKETRVICGARRRRDGQPCQALSVPGKRRCKWHGGCSTGPKTEQGRTKSLRNLLQYREAPSSDLNQASGLSLCVD